MKVSTVLPAFGAAAAIMVHNLPIIEAFVPSTVGVVAHPINHFSSTASRVHQSCDFSMRSISRPTAASSTSLMMSSDSADDVSSGDGEPFPQSIAYKGIQIGVAVAFLGLADAGFSGDWAAQGFVTTETEAICREVFKLIAGIHVLSAGAGAVVAANNGASIVNAVIGGLLTGALDVGRVATYQGGSKEESSSSTGGGSSDAIKEPNPLSMELKSEEMRLRTSANGKLLTTVIVAKKASADKMRAALEQLVEAVLTKEQRWCYTMTVNQNPQEPTEFLMVQRFPDARALAAHRGGESYVAFLASVEDVLAQPMGLHLVNERFGKLAEAVHPFGPGGEGGRDDAIYSSPANVQGSSFTAKQASEESLAAGSKAVEEALQKK